MNNLFILISDDKKVGDSKSSDREHSVKILKFNKIPIF